MKNVHTGKIICTAIILISVLLTSCDSTPVEKETGVVVDSSGEDKSADNDIEQTPKPALETPVSPSPDDKTEKDETGKEIEQESPGISDEFYITMDNHFGFMPAFYDYASAKEAGGIWTRPNFERFTWGWIEQEPGSYTFSETDREVQEAQRYGFHILANVQPKALWDEEKCHEVTDKPSPGIPIPFTEAYKPCDMDAYKSFVTTLVERYDGDGNNDMPGLTVPIKHWEIMNEPEFSNYFLGTPGEYVEIVEASATAIREADPDAVIVQGGMAGMAPEMTNFWRQVFDLGVAQYFDVLNMHSIGHGEHLNIPAFRQFLSDYDVSEKPVWVTEVQYQQAGQTRDSTPEQFAGTMARSYIFALANGVDKLLYVNLKIPQGAPGNIPFDERSALIDNNGMKTPLYFAHKTISETLGKLDKDDEIVVIREKVGDWFIEEGQYKFTIDGKSIYALWGTGPVPGEIQGTVTVTDISGMSRIIDISELQLSDSPVFVQLAE